MSTATRTTPAARRRPRLVAFVLADDERRPGYVAGSRTHDGVTHDVVPGPVLPVPVIIAARIGLLAAGLGGGLAAVAAIVSSLRTWIGA
jgi:hypothetical protein